MARGRERIGHGREVFGGSIGYPSPGATTRGTSAGPPHFDTWLPSPPDLTSLNDSGLDAPVDGYSPARRSAALACRLSFASVSSASCYSDAACGLDSVPATTCPDLTTSQATTPDSLLSTPPCLSASTWSAAAASGAGLCARSPHRDPFATVALPSWDLRSLKPVVDWQEMSGGRDEAMEVDGGCDAGESDELFAELSGMLGVEELGW